MSKLEALGGKNQHSSLPWFEYLQPPKTLQEFNILQLSANLSTEELLHASSPWIRICEVRFKFLTYTSKLIQGKYCGCSITATQKNRICYDFWGLFGNTVYFWTKVILLHWKEVEKKTKEKKSHVFHNRHSSTWEAILEQLIPIQISQYWWDLKL